MKPSFAIGLLLTVAGIATLGWGATTAGEVDRPAGVERRGVAEAYTRAAEAAYGRRVLVLHAKPREPVRGEVLEAVRAAGGWGLFEGVPSGAEALGRSLDAIARRAAADWDARRTVTEPVVRDLAGLGVAVVLVEDGQKPVVPGDDAVDVPGVSAETRVPGLRVRGAELVFRGERATEPASILDPQDLAWGGSVTVDVSEAGPHVFVWPAGGADVTLDGAATEPRADGLGRLVLDLPAGRPVVRVTYGGDSRGFMISAGAAALVIGLVLVLRAVRPEMEHDGGDDSRGDDSRGDDGDPAPQPAGGASA